MRHQSTASRALIGALTILLSVGAAACGGDDVTSTTTTTTSTPAAVTATAGSGQTVVAGAAVTTPFAVKVVGPSGTALSGITVTWAVASGGGTLAGTTSTTDASGLATTTYTAGSTAGTSNVTATVSGLTPVTFTTTITAAPTTANTIAIASGNAQTVTAGAAVTMPFTVKVTNASGTAVSGAAVTFAIAAGGGTLGTASATTDANGAASTTYTAGTTAGTATVTATISGASSVTFTTTVTSGTTGSVSDSTTARVIGAITAFKTTLSTAQQTSLQLAYTQTLAARWSNLPCALSCRNGLLLGSLSSTQLTAALAVAKVALGDSGYARFQSIRAADTYLGQSASGYGEGNYVIAVLGTPSTSARWMVQLGGHHHAYNLAFNGTATPTVTTTSPTPYHVAIEPQTFTLNGTTYTPLQTRKVAMYTMINSLDATQKTSAQLSQTFDDMLLGPGKDWQFPTQQGLVGSSLTAAQKALVKTAIEAWVTDEPTAQATALLADYEADTSLAKTYVAWSKSTDSTVAGSYIRIDGPRVWIEFVCQNGVVFRNQIHFHTVWRDKLRDYGGTISTASIETAAFARDLAMARTRFAPTSLRPDDWLASH